MGRINDYLSKKITFISMISMLAVVFAHAYNYTDSFLKPHTIITEGLNLGACLQFAIANSLTRFSVPMFFMISGFLFFYGREFSTSTYLNQMKKRCRSILSVFLIFSAISFVVCHIVYSFTGAGVIPMIDERMVKSTLYALFQNPYAFQLWFLLQLFIMSIISPVIYFLLKKLKFVLPVILACLWALDKHLVIGEFTLFNCDAYTFFTVGAYIAMNSDKIKGLFEKRDNKKAWIISTMLWLGIAVVYTLFCATARETSPVQLVLFKLSMVSGIVAIWFLYDRISQSFLERPLVKTISKNNFMVYLLHEPLMHMIFMPTAAAYFSSDLVHALLFFVLPVIIIILCAYTGKFLREKLPGVNNILTGGR